MTAGGCWTSPTAKPKRFELTLHGSEIPRSLHLGAKAGFFRWVTVLFSPARALLLLVLVLVLVLEGALNGIEHEHRSLSTASLSTSTASLSTASLSTSTASHEHRFAEHEHRFAEHEHRFAEHEHRFAEHEHRFAEHRCAEYERVVRCIRLPITVYSDIHSGSFCSSRTHTQ